MKETIELHNLIQYNEPSVIRSKKSLEKTSLKMEDTNAVAGRNSDDSVSRTVLPTKDFARLRRIYLSNRGARSKPIEIRVADISPNRGAPVFRGQNRVKTSPILRFGRGVGNTDRAGLYLNVC